MSDAPWRFALASALGTGHEQGGTPCQDRAAARLVEAPGGAAFLVVVACDGAGSACMGHAGAEIVRDLFVEEISARIAAGDRPDTFTNEFATALIEQFQAGMDALAVEADLDRRAYATTFVGAIVGVTDAVFMQVGDGAIVVSDEASQDEYAWIFWPDKGDYANTTRFVTDSDAVAHVRFDRSDRRVVELAIFTDGLEAIALHSATRTAHAPFFRSMFRPLRQLPRETDAAPADDLSLRLATFLGSQRVNERTDDDKTLILASRVIEVPSPVETMESDPIHDATDDMR